MKTGICKHTRFVLGVLLSATTITACSNFLDTEQLGVTTQEAFYKTDQDATEALYAIYNKWQSNSLSFFQFRNLLSDDVIGGGGSRGDNSQGEEIDEFRFGPSNTMLTGCFEQYYEIIYAANVLIANVNPDTEIKTQAVAEAKALRALAYIDLVSLWGPVPLVTKPLQPSEYAQPNGEVSAIWSQIETDLNEAISVLPLKSQLSAAKKGNVAKGTAQAWLGKAYLYQKKYDEAAAMFDNVINSGEYDLEKDFSQITRASTEFGIESLFEISFSDDISTLTEGTSIVAYCGPRSPWFKAGTSGISETAWGWCEPTLDLYDAFVEAGDEIRRKGTVINEDELINVYGGSFRDESGNLPYGSYGCVRMKYGAYVAETQGEDYHTIAGTNYRITRYADVLLMAAEAYNRKSSPDDSKAQEYINRVRSRVELPNLTSTGDELFNDIKKERRLELAFEFVRYQDLIRWGDAEEVLKDAGKQIPRGDGTYYEFPDAGFKERHWLLPFPETEMNVNPNLTQNPGW